LVILVQARRQSLRLSRIQSSDLQDWMISSHVALSTHVETHDDAFGEVHVAVLLCVQQQQIGLMSKQYITTAPCIKCFDAANRLDTQAQLSDAYAQ